MRHQDDEVSLFPDPTPTETLAHVLGLPVDEFVEVFGAGWKSAPEQGHDFDADPSGIGNLFGPWFVAGDPFQLMLRPMDGGAELAVPVGRWAGAHTLMWQAENRRFVPGFGDALLATALPVVTDVLRRRRGTFRYCRYCRRLTPPEERLEPDVCYGCGTAWRGVIY
jgi:hypothetical protein